MLQMLGLRGSPSAGDAGGDAPVRNGGEGGGGPGRPLRLVYCDEKGKFVMDPEAVAALQLVKGPVGVVSVCGRARQGKSFVLNQLLGRSSGFQVAPTHRPCTKGLWMWSAPLKRTGLDGTEYNLVLLDTEGIDAYDQTGTYSIQIFSLAVLLSSMFIYNQMGGIDEAALDRLSLVTEMTKHIRVRASGGRSTESELGHFSPVFVWLLRDFYLDLTEDNRKITPRDYLELALRPVQGGGRDVSSKNAIRESIRALFPDRECITLVRPVNNEKDLQRLDQLPLNNFRPEFRSGLDALTKFVFDRTRPKQLGASTLTGPVLAGLTQSFLDAINTGAVPTISSSWQSVEEAECRRAYDSAIDTYNSSFDRRKPAEEDAMREAHEDALKKAVSVFNASAVGAGLARSKFEKLLQTSLKKAFEDYKRNTFLEADLQCSNRIQSMESKIRTACNRPDAKLDDIVRLIDGLLTEYESKSYGPGKWKKLATFLQHLAGPVLDLFRRQIEHIDAERNSLRLKCSSNDDKLALLRKQLEASEGHRAEYLRRYEESINDKQKISRDYSGRIAELQTKSSKLEERCVSLSSALDNAKRESVDWKNKYDHNLLQQKADESKLKSQIASLESRVNISEGRLSAVREQAESAQEEASEWKRKYEVAVSEAKTALQRAAVAQERTNKKVQEREDALRAELASQLSEKEEEIARLNTKINQTEIHATNLISRLEATEAKLKNHESDSLALKEEIRSLTVSLESFRTEAQSREKEVKILEQEKNHLQEKYLTECKRFDEADRRCKEAEREAKRATELADVARAEAVASQKDKGEAQRLAMERLALIERMERQVEGLEREKNKMLEEIERVGQSEKDAVCKVSSLEQRVDEREKEIDEMMQRSNQQRSSTVQVLESLLETEREACAEANRRAEALSLQLQATQSKLDMLQQELTSVRFNETALDSKLKASHARRLRGEATESVHDMDIDDDNTGRRRKRSKSTTSPFKSNHTEDGGSVFVGEDTNNGSQQAQETETEDYTKFTVLKLKQELTKHGFGAQLLQLKNPNKKDIVALYEKHVVGK
uniref:GB1/RHD3-type G domain-containing protein n=1 Tax=Oryza nivara TaxID=4536 RepID=A0A0E0HIF3_ORYNI